MKVKLCQPVGGSVGEVVEHDDEYAAWLISTGYAVKAQDSTSESAKDSTSQSAKSAGHSAKPSTSGKAKAQH